MKPIIFFTVQNITLVLVILNEQVVTSWPSISLKLCPWVTWGAENDGKIYLARRFLFQPAAVETSGLVSFPQRIGDPTQTCHCRHARRVLAQVANQPPYPAWKFGSCGSNSSKESPFSFITRTVRAYVRPTFSPSFRVE